MLGLLNQALGLLLAATAMAGPIKARSSGPTVVTPGGVNDIILTKQNTLNGTFSGAGVVNSVMTTADTGAITLSLVNNLASSSVNVYVTGTVNGAVALLASDGSWYYPAGTTSTTPVEITEDIATPIGAEGTTTTITIPSYVSAGRIYIADGDLTFYVVSNGDGGASLVEPSTTNPSDPSADINWGFIELTWTEAGGLYINLSYIDFVGLPLGMSVTSTDGTVQTDLGLPADSVDTICAALADQTATDGYPWSSLCQTDTNGNYLRAIGPYDYISTDSTAFEGYFSDYVSEVWSTYSTDTLTIVTQAAAGNVTCTTGGTDTMTCEGSDVTFAEPSAADIFGCNSGPFVVDGNSVDAAIVPRLCAAFNRAELLLSGGNITPSLDDSHYYTVSPCNYYSKIIHEYELDGKGYAFSYDDVNPTGSENASGELTSTTPELITITVGGPSS